MAKLYLVAIAFAVFIQSSRGKRYDVWTKTTDGSFHRGFGTNDNVFISVTGIKDGKTVETGFHQLSGPGDRFEKGNLDKFIIDTSDVGKITSITMRREKAYVIDDKWHLEYVKVGDGGIWSKIDYGDWIDSTGHRMKVSSCEPQPGTKKKNGYCEDLNECNENPSICGVDGKCYNLPGTYECLCKPGFEKRDGVCKDINECAQPNHGCQDKCVNTVGSYRCECNLGFKPLTAGSKRCKNINECQENRPCVSPAVCMDTVGSYYCKCPDGYEADGPHRCKDVNECMTFHECDYQTSECVNQPVGSYTCKCRQGFKPSLKSPRLVCE
ncbi:predicted protein, partial [Nematostella vectensis]